LYFQKDFFRVEGCEYCSTTKHSYKYRTLQIQKVYTMKSFLICLAALTSVNAFVAPSVKSNRVAVTSSSSSSTTSLNLFGMFEKSIAVPPPQKISEGEVRALFYLWNDALATEDSRLVAKRYSSDPILLPTVSDEPRTDFASIKDYFDNFLKLKPQGVILDGKIKIGHNWAKDAGIYEFTMGSTGAKVKARYSFIYVFEDNQWKIAHHHSSAMPETKGKKIDEAQVRNLFFLWNDALGTSIWIIVTIHLISSHFFLPSW
jgi:uncharacterized protein (TIGR02246 family)